MTSVDYILVGQGLAGSILGYKLMQQGQQICIVDENKSQTSSKIAIGLVNPITGKRLVKSWLIDDLIPTAQSFYQSLEKQFAAKYIHNAEIARIIPNDDIFQQWQPNFKQAVEEGYIHPNLEEIQTPKGLQSYFRILNGFWLDTLPFLTDLQTYFIQQKVLIRERFDYSALEMDEAGIKYKKIRGKGIVFCEGAAGRHNPFCKHLPFNLNKGEIIDVDLGSFSFDSILKQNIFIVPNGRLHRVGSTYDRQFLDDQPTKAALAYFQEKMDQLLNLEYQIIKHQAAIRPATQDRRPFLGQLQNNMYIFNGFGAKGVSLIPYFGQHFTDYLLDGKELAKEVAISRLN